MFVPARAREPSQTGCLDCPVKIPCLTHALDNRIQVGIFGGWSQRERQALLRLAPAISSWHRIAEAADADFEKALAFAQHWMSPEEEAAFTAVFRARFVPLVGFLIKAGGSRHDAEDAVQSACVELAKTWHRVECPEPWLRTTAYRMWLKSVHRLTPNELTDEFQERPATCQRRALRRWKPEHGTRSVRGPGAPVRPFSGSLRGAAARSPGCPRTPTRRTPAAPRGPVTAVLSANKPTPGGQQLESRPHHRRLRRR